MILKFNHFTAGTCVKFIEDQIWVLIVHYFDNSDHKQCLEVRLPGGTVQFCDMISSVKKSYSQIGLSQDKFVWLIKEIEKAEQDFEKEKSTMPAQTNSEKFAIREKFVAYLNYVGELIESVVFKDEHLMVIENQARIETLIRELEEEVAVTEWVEEIQCGSIEKKGHIKYPYLVLGSNAPDSYSGSPDKDIMSSEFFPMEKAWAELVPSHRTFLSNTLSELRKIYSSQDDKKIFVEKINAILKPNV